MVRAIFRYAMLLAILLAVGLVVFVAVTYPRFQADTQSNRERLLSGSDVLTTEEFRDIEYAVQGEGLLVLLAHGAGGGYDQGLLIGNNYVGESHHLIAPSRFGYLRSSIPALASMTTTAHKILYWLTASLCIPQGRTFRPTPRLLPENPRETVRGVPLARSRRKFGQDREGETSPNVPFDRRMGLGLVGQGCSPVRNFSDSL